MLNVEMSIGNYVSWSQTLKHRSQRVSESSRKEMILLIQELHKKKEYKVETLHLASSIADRYLCSLVRRQCRELPNLTQLATISMLMAAKLE